MELEEYFRAYRTHWVAIVVATVLGALVALGWTALQPKVYTSSGSAIITTGSAASIDEALKGDDYAKSRVKSYLDFAKSRQVGTFAAEELGVDSSPESLIARVSVSSPSDTAVLRVQAEGPTPEAAHDLAEAWIAGMTAVVKDIETGPEPFATTVVELETLDSATFPSSPSSPNTKMALLVGLAGGLAIGVAYALFRAVMDRRLRRPEDVEAKFDLPAVGALPFDGSIAKMGVMRASHDFAMTEAVRQLRTNLQFMDVDGALRVVVVTSSMPGDGKSTASVLLAQAIADSGTEVVLIDADLRRPALARSMGLVEGAGLTDVLLGRAEADDVLQDYGTSGRLRVMGSGRIPPNPSELLGSKAMQALLYSFPEDVFVLVDTPPLVPVTDAAILTARSDGALVVARAAHTTTDLLDRALRKLDKVKGRALGVILTAVPRTGVHADRYDYSYDYVHDRGTRKERIMEAIKPSASAAADSADAGEHGDTEALEEAIRPADETGPDTEEEKADADRADSAAGAITDADSDAGADTDTGDDTASNTNTDVDDDADYDESDDAPDDGLGESSEWNDEDDLHGEALPDGDELVLKGASQGRGRPRKRAAKMPRPARH